MMKFDLPKDHSSIIKVIGVGGGGSNAVNHMYKGGIQGVDFMICNTDAQALDKSEVPTKIQLGASLTEGRGAGAIPDVGRNAAIESIDEIKDMIEKNTTMVFITAGMGGGTGTGAAPVIAQAAKDLGILTVGIVTVPFVFEGKKRKEQAELGLEEMRKSVDTLLVINNDKLRESFGNLSLKDAFSKADDVLATAAKGIAEVVSITGEINVDMNDVQTVMKDSGVAIMGSGTAEGEERAMKAVTTALESPLLNDNDIKGAKFVLLNITYGTQDIMMDEISIITDHIQESAGATADVIWGYAKDEELGDKISVTVVATGFQSTGEINNPDFELQKKYVNLEEDINPVTKKMSNPFESRNGNTSGGFNGSATKKEEPFLKQTEEVKPTPNPVVAPQNTAPVPPPTAVTNEVPTNQIEEVENEIEMEQEQAPEPEMAAQPKPEPPVEKVFLMLDDDDDEEGEAAPKEEVNNNTETASEEIKIGAAEQINIFGERKSPMQEQELIEERISKIKEMSIKMRTPGGLSELEKEPAYVRANFKFKKTQDNSDNSNMSMGKDSFISNNSFLHDNVD